MTEAAASGVSLDLGSARRMAQWMDCASAMSGYSAAASLPADGLMLASFLVVSFEAGVSVGSTSILDSSVILFDGCDCDCD